MIQGLFKPKISLVTTGISLSWIPQTGEKRKAETQTPITTTSAQPKKQRPEGLYIPPQRKNPTNTNKNPPNNKNKKGRF